MHSLKAQAQEQFTKAQAHAQAQFKGTGIVEKQQRRAAQALRNHIIASREPGGDLSCNSLLHQLPLELIIFGLLCGRGLLMLQLRLLQLML